MLILPNNLFSFVIYFQQIRLFRLYILYSIYEHFAISMFWSYTIFVYSWTITFSPNAYFYTRNLVYLIQVTTNRLIAGLNKIYYNIYTLVFHYLIRR